MANMFGPGFDSLQLHKKAPQCGAFSLKKNLRNWLLIERRIG